MAKYAVMVGSSHSYMQGLNATLNALDYYGVKDIDVYVFSNKFLKPYFEYMDGKFNFPLYYIDAEELCPDHETHFADDGGVAWKDVMFFWGKYPLMFKIMHQYDAIMHLDGDCMLVDDVSEYLELAAKTGKILIAGNDRSTYSLGQIVEDRFNTSEDALIDFCKGFPVLNYAFILDAKKYVPFLKYVWALRNDHKRNTKHFGLETAYFVQGLFKCNLLDSVTILPFKYWISDNYLNREDVKLEKDENGKYHLIAPDGNKLKVVHGRFWNDHTSKSTIEISKPERSPYNSKYNYDLLLRNMESHTRMTDFLNYEWKSKLDEVLKRNPHYGSYLYPTKAWDRISKWLEVPWSAS